MRVALFFDGKNHMKDLRRAAGERWLDHEALARWVVQHVGGTSLFAAYYYTGVPTPQDEGQERHALSDLLEDLERKPGFFVRRFNRRASTRECPHCHEVIAYTEEKMVDTSLVADMILFAVRDAYDVAVVFSGDLDVAPGLQAVHALGKKAWIATFGEGGLSRSLTRAAWGAIDLMQHIDLFSYAELGTAPVPKAPETPEEVDREILRELRRAQAHFGAGGGFVGAHYFIHRWKGHHIPDAPDLRRQALQRLMGEALVETYTSEGKTALRAAPEAGAIEDADLETEAGPRAEPHDVPNDPRDLMFDGVTGRHGHVERRPIDPLSLDQVLTRTDRRVSVRTADGEPGRMPPEPPKALEALPMAAPEGKPLEEDETVEVRLSDTMKRIRRHPARDED